MRNFDLIREMCEVVEEITSPIHAIYYIDGGSGYVDTDVVDEGEYLAYSCDSIEEFHEIVDLIC